MSNAEVIEVTPSQKTPIPALQNQPLHSCVQRSMQDYFAQLGDQPISNLYDMVLAEIEPPLLRSVLDRTNGNQSKAALLLTMSRSTLRKKLIQYGIIS